MVIFQGLGPVSRVAFLAALHLFLDGCRATQCTEGTEDCACAENGRCDEGLVCEERVCKADESSGARKPPKTPGKDAGAGGTDSGAGADGGGEEPDDSGTSGAAGSDSGGSTTGGSGGAGSTPPDGVGGSSGSDSPGGAGGDAAETGGSAGNGGSANAGAGGTGGTSTGGTNAGGTNAGGTNAGGTSTGGLAGSGGVPGPVAFPPGCRSCIVEGCAQAMSLCRGDATCAACTTTSYVSRVCAENAAYSAVAACFCNNFCAAHCSDVCE
jgi:hypothetical protein